MNELQIIYHLPNRLRVSIGAHSLGIPRLDLWELHEACHIVNDLRIRSQAVGRHTTMHKVDRGAALSERSLSLCCVPLLVTVSSYGALKPRSEIEHGDERAAGMVAGRIPHAKW